MSVEQALLGKLKDEQAKYALQSMQMPSAKNEFEYGFRCGKVAGLEAAMNLLLDMFKEERDGEKGL